MYSASRDYPKLSKEAIVGFAIVERGSSKERKVVPIVSMTDNCGIIDNFLIDVNDGSEFNEGGDIISSFTAQPGTFLVYGYSEEDDEGILLGIENPGILKDWKKILEYKSKKNQTDE